MTIQTPEQELCRVDGESLSIILPSTTLILTMEEADTLNCILQNDLLYDLFDEMHGDEIGETVLVADVVISRSEAWQLHRSLENIVFRDDDSNDGEDAANKVGWIVEGF